MGLLDSFFGNGWEDPKTAAVLQLAAGLQSGRTLGQGLTQGAIGYNSTLANARAQAQAQEAQRTHQALQQQLIQAQIGETNAQAQQRQAQVTEAERRAAEQQRQMQLLQRAFSPVTPIQANQASGVSGPRPEALASVGQQAPVNYQQLIAQGLPPELVKSLADAANFGRSKVARTIKGMGPDGREFEYQVDEFGNRIGEGLAQYRAPITVNQGNKTTFADPYNLKPMGAFQTFQSPDSAASVGATLRGQNMADARARESNAISLQNGKVPPGYRMLPNGDLQAIPGGPQAAALAESATLKQGRSAAFETAIQSLDGLLKHPGFSAGVGASMQPRIPGYGEIPGTDKAGFVRQLEAFKAQTFLPMVEQLRGTGALSNAEGDKLTAAVGALSGDMKESEFRASAGRIRADLEAARARAGGVPRPAGGATGSWDAGAAPSQAPAVRRFNPATGRIE